MEELKLTFVNVGYGEAALLECPAPAFPGGTFVMVIAGGSAVFDGCDTSQIVLWLAGHLHVNKIQETSPGPSVVNISTLDGGRYNLFDIDGGRLRVTTVDPRTGSRTAWHSAELNIKTDNR